MLKWGRRVTSMLLLSFYLKYIRLFLSLHMPKLIQCNKRALLCDSDFLCIGAYKIWVFKFYDKCRSSSETSTRFSYCLSILLLHDWLWKEFALNICHLLPLVSHWTLTLTFAPFGLSFLWIFICLYLALVFCLKPAYYYYIYNCY